MQFKHGKEKNNQKPFFPGMDTSPRVIDLLYPYLSKSRRGLHVFYTGMALSVAVLSDDRFHIRYAYRNI